MSWSGEARLRVGGQHLAVSPKRSLPLCVWVWAAPGRLHARCILCCLQCSQAQRASPVEGQQEGGHLVQHELVKQQIVFLGCPDEPVPQLQVVAAKVLGLPSFEGVLELILQGRGKMFVWGLVTGSVASARNSMLCGKTKACRSAVPFAGTLPALAVPCEDEPHRNAGLTDQQNLPSSREPSGQPGSLPPTRAPEGL